MKVTGRDVIDEACKRHTDCEQQLRAWLAEAEAATWKNTAELKARYAHASIISATRVIFNIKGNHYRLDIKISFAAQIIVVKRFGTHAEYSKWEF